MTSTRGTVMKMNGTRDKADGLTETDRAVLAIERAFYRVPGSKAQRIRVELDLSETRYYQLLNALLDKPAALATDPVLVGRLRRIREAHRPSTTDE